MRKIIHLLKELRYLVAEHKLYFIAPILMMMAALAILFFHLGPAIIISFIYAGA